MVCWVADPVFLTWFDRSAQPRRRLQTVARPLQPHKLEETMSLKDKLEIGLKPDAPYRPDNLPDSQKDDPACQQGAEPGDAPAEKAARDACDDPAATRPDGGQKKAAKPRTDGVPKE